MAAMLVITTALAQDNIRIQVNGEEIMFNGQQPISQNGRTLIPVRGVFDALGYDIGWDSTEQNVTLTAKDGTVVSLWIGYNQLSVRSEVRIPRVNLITMDVPAQIINGNTMIPLRAVADAIGADVQWDGTQNMAIISYREHQDSHIHFTWGNGETWIYRMLEDGRLAEITPGRPRTVDVRIVRTGSFEYRLVHGMPADYTDATFQNLLDMGYTFEDALDIFEEQIFHATNRARVEHGVQPLAWSDALMRAARVHSQDMAVNDFVGHTGFDGSSANDRAIREGFRGGANENAGLRSHLSTPDAFIVDWMHSPPHRANMLRSGARYLGIGITFVINADGSIGRGYAVQKFGF